MKALAELAAADSGNVDLAKLAGTRALELLERLQNVPAIQTSAEADRVIGYVRKLQQAHAVLVSERDTLAKPLRKIANSISKRWKPSIDAYEAAIKILRDAHGAFMSSRQLAAQLELEGAVDTEQIAKVVEIMAPPTEGTHQRTTWHCEVTDPRAFFDFVRQAGDPARWATPNAAELNAHARKSRGTEPIPGTREYSKTTTIVSKQ
ncbi:MAG: hypothetical protein VYA51_12870 [Planctomycetota bacterium]|nr:hypothetical protein [Planctomycetota bacterium]